MSVAITTVARPYAKALFTLAWAQHTLLDWTQLLTATARIVQDPRVCLSHPQFKRIEFWAELMACCGTLILEQGKKFFRLLIAQRRLVCLPKIAELFNHYHAQREQRITVCVASVIPLSEELRCALRQALSARLHAKVECNYHIEPSLLGGLVIRADDLVIDSSLQNHLSRLHRTLID